MQLSSLLYIISGATYTVGVTSLAQGQLSGGNGGGTSSGGPGIRLLLPPT